MVPLDEVELFILSNGSIVTARVNGGQIHFNLWAEGDTKAEPKKFVISPEVAPRYVWDYQINRNVALVKYESDLGSDHYDLWYLTQPAGYHISGYLPYSGHQPNCDSFLTAEELEMTSESGFERRLMCNWLLDTNWNSEYLVRLYSRGSSGMFVLVFDGFTSSKFKQRITMPENVRDYCINMRIIGQGKDAKTVLTAQTQDPYTFVVYDMSNGQTLLTIPLGRYHGSSGHYLFPKGELTEEDHVLGGVDVIRIDFDGKNWTTSSAFASYGEDEEYDDEMRLVEVTDTQTLWEVDRADESSYSILCDYLLNDIDTSRLDNNNQTET